MQAVRIACGLGAYIAKLPVPFSAFLVDCITRLVEALAEHGVAQALACVCLYQPIARGLSRAVLDTFENLCEFANDGNL